MKTKILRLITFLLKFVSGLLVASPLWGADAGSAGIGALLFIAVSCFKELLLCIGDFIDDGKRNNSFRIP